MIRAFAILFVFVASFFAGNDDITTALKALENGNKNKATEILKTLRKNSPSSPETLLLEALLNENGEEAKAFYEFIYEEHPNFRYADLCLYRLYSYYYAIGNYITAEKYLNKLRNEYPNSPYSISSKVLPEPKQIVRSNSKKTKEKQNRKFAIQVGAFSNLTNAEKIREKFIRTGYVARISKKIIGQNIFNIVTVGEFENKERAERKAMEISRKFNIRPRIIKLVR